MSALPRMSDALITLLRLGLIATLWLAVPASADNGQVARIGVLAFRDIEATRQQWTPLAEHLTRQIEGTRFDLVPLQLDDLNRAVAAGNVDFVLTQPEDYIVLRTRYGLAAVATLTPLAGGRPVSRFGGVIVTHAGRNDINGLADLRDKTVAAVHRNSLGAYRVQQWTLSKAGIELPGDVKDLVFTGLPQDVVISQVLDGRADAGFVRTGLIESMVDEAVVGHRRAAGTNHADQDAKQVGPAKGNRTAVQP